jgi:hypothetical protein
MTLPISATPKVNAGLFLKIKNNQQRMRQPPKKSQKTAHDSDSDSSPEKDGEEKSTVPEHFIDTNA